MSFTQGHALIIGVGSYHHAPRLDVPIAARDATAVKRILQDEQYCGYPAQQITLLEHTTATRDEVLAALDSLAKRTNEQDTVFLYYAGHGVYDADNNYYLTTHDSQFQGQYAVTGSGSISEKELLEQLRQLKAKRVVIVCNTCHAGSIGPHHFGADVPSNGHNLPEDTAMALLGTGEGRVIITACRKEQKSYFDGQEPTTPFGRALIDGLQGRDMVNRKGYISVFDLYSYVFDTVKSSVKRRWNIIQEPELTIIKGVGMMAVALYQGHTPTADHLGADDQSPKLEGVREKESEACQTMLSKMLQGKVAAGRDISGIVAENIKVQGNLVNAPNAQNSTIIAGDQINAPGTKGFINRPSGPISQNFGSQRIISGDYAEGDIDKRTGAFVSGGAVYGPVTGVNMGRVIYETDRPSPSSQEATLSLERMILLLQQEIKQAHQRNEQHYVQGLEEVEAELQDALTAQDKGDTNRKQKKLRRAQEDLAELATQYPTLRDLVQKLQQVR